MHISLSVLTALGCLGAPAAAQLQFAQLAGYELPHAVEFTPAIALGDVDGDGDLDLLCGNGGYQAAQQNRLYRNDGRGRFVDVTALSLPVAMDFTSAVAFGDVDGDGDLDLVCGNSGFNVGGEQNRLYRNDGTGRFTDVTAASLPADADAAMALACADVDGDGDLDLLVGNWNGQSRLYQNHGNGAFVDVSATHLPTTAPTHAVALGDIDGDGDPDILLAEDSGYRLLRNGGNGVFTDASAGNVPAGVTVLVALADVDGDGDLDLVGSLHTPGSATLTLALNDGHGLFTDVSATHLPASQIANDVAFGDVDGDGDLDLVYAGIWFGRGCGCWGLTNGLLLNDRTGRFANSGRVAPLTQSAPALACGDVDGDGDQDLVLGGGSNRLELNLLRQLHASTTLRIGQTWTLDAYLRYGPPSTTDLAVPAIAFGSASIALPGLGTLGLDPATMIVLPPVAIPQPGGVGQVTIPVPNQPGLVGLTVFAQALVVPLPFPARLGNVVSDVVQ